MIPLRDASNIEHFCFENLIVSFNRLINFHTCTVSWMTPVFDSRWCTLLSLQFRHTNWFFCLSTVSICKDSSFRKNVQDRDSKRILCSIAYASEMWYLRCLLFFCIVCLRGLKKKVFSNRTTFLGKYCRHGVFQDPQTSYSLSWCDTVLC